MYIDNLNELIKFGVFNGGKADGAPVDKNEFGSLLKLLGDTWKKSSSVPVDDGSNPLFSQTKPQQASKQVVDTSYLKERLKNFSNTDRPYQPQDDIVKSVDKEGLKISLNWQDGEITKKLEAPILKQQQHGRNLKTMNDILFNNYKNEESHQVGFGKIADNEAWQPHPKVKEKVVVHNKKRLNVNNMDTLEFIKMKKPIESMLESKYTFGLQDILGIKNNETSGGAAFDDNLDILRLGDIKRVDTKNLVGRITDYLIHNGIKNLDFLEVIVEHEDLGKFKIDAQKTGMKGQVDLKIEVMSDEGRDFFRQNEALLAKDLARSGVNIQELKIVDSKENVLFSSFPLKEESSILNLGKDIQHEENNRENGNKENKKDERNYRSREDFINDEEGDA